MAQEEHIHRHLAALAAGLLNEEDEQRCREHLAACEGCSQAWEDYREGLDAHACSGGHIPSGVIAHWDTASGALRGLERELVQQHLADCPDCRADLELLGFEPKLGGELLSEPEPANQSARGLAAPARISEGRPESRRGWLPWIIGGWAVAATAAALFLVLLPRTGPTSVAKPDRGLGVLPWVAPELLRGSGAGEPLEVPAGTRSIILVLRVPPEMQLVSEAVVEVRSPEDETLIRSAVTHHAVKRGMVMLVLERSEPLDPGSYTVLFWKTDPDLQPSEPAESHFGIRFPVVKR